MSFQETIDHRPAEVHADFLLPLLRGDMRVLDLGCGPGSITVGLASGARLVVGVDLRADGFGPARGHLRQHGIAGVHFVAGDGGRLPFPTACFDAVLLHSILEAARDPSALVREAHRVLVPGGIVAAASVDYGGLVVAGPERDVLEAFYSARERLWALDGIARPRSGRDLRRLLHDGGFTGVVASARYLTYGTPDAVRSFGEARVRDCTDSWFRSRSAAHGIAAPDDLLRMQRAWEAWSRAPDAFLAFAWCRAIGFR